MDRELEGEGRDTIFCHCVWHSVTLLISTAGTQRYECWEFKQRLLGHWQRCCFASCLHVLKYWTHSEILLSVSLSSLMNGIKFKQLGFYKTYPTPSVGSLVIELGQQTCLPHKFIYTAVDIGYPICTVGNVAWQCAICAVCTWALVQQYKQCPELCVGKRMFFFLKLTSLFFTPSFSQPPFFFCFWVYLCARACIWHLSGGLRVMPWSCRRTRPQLHARSEMPSVKLHPSACHSVRQETI